MESKENLIKHIENFCEDFGVEFVNDYSGRCMYGRKCVGIVCDNPLQMAMELQHYLDVEDIDSEVLASSVASDSMGMQKIVYFPRLSAE